MDGENNNILEEITSPRAQRGAQIIVTLITGILMVLLMPAAWRLLDAVTDLQREVSDLRASVQVISSRAVEDLESRLIKLEASNNVGERWTLQMDNSRNAVTTSKIESLAERIASLDTRVTRLEDQK